MKGIRFDDDDALTELDVSFAHNHISNREDIWRWLYLYQHERQRLDRDTCNGSSMRDSIAGALRGNKGLVNDLRSQRDKFILPAADLDWIKEDARQLSWLFDQVNDFTEQILPSGLSHLTGRDEIIAMIDLWKTDLSNKKSRIRRLHDRWQRQQIKDIDLEWFQDRKEGAKRCSCARDWLLNNSQYQRLARKHPIKTSPDLAMFFEEAEVSQFERKAVIKDIKARWSRLQFNERNADKKQINLMLSKKVIDQLDELATHHGMKRAQIIEALVKHEASAGEYLKSPGEH